MARSSSEVVVCHLSVHNYYCYQQENNSADMLVIKIEHPLAFGFGLLGESLSLSI
jgi:hypothetical protein